MADKTRSKQDRPNRLIGGVNTPFDPDLFAFCCEIAGRAARGEMVDSHIPPPSGPGLWLTDNPVNRAMMAVSRECEHIPQDAQFALLWRVMEGYKLLEAAADDPRFADFIRVEDGGEVSISPELAKAYGSVPLIFDGDDTRPDMDAIWEALQ